MEIFFGDVQDISTIDYPGEVVSVLFFCGCPLRCPFCHNYNLVNQSNCDQISVNQIIDHIKKSIPFITGVAITGGEPTQQIDPLIDLIKKFKELKLLVKIDTNGYYSRNLKRLCELDIVDYFALDIKNELKPKSYARSAGLSIISGPKIVKRIKQSIEILINSNSFFEARTTIVPSLNDSETIIGNICQDIVGVNRYVLQEFRCLDKVLDDKFCKIPSPPRNLMLHLSKIAKEYIDDVRIRTAKNGEERI
ncbi:MAG: anaerobic ribonucleoside-triphosphate reductase activating protein [Candidatus Helarchaeota archaeon]